MDVIDANVADVRFLQATRHGEVLTPVELIEGHAAVLGDAADRLLARVRRGESLGIALVREAVPEPTRKQLLGHFVSEDLADALDRHYRTRRGRRSRGRRSTRRARSTRWSTISG